MHWISSAGGPLVLIPETDVRYWRGAMDGGADYNAACGVVDYASVIMVGSMEVLVLNDEPLATSTFVDDGILVLVRWMYAPSEDVVMRLLPDMRSQLPSPSEETKFHCHTLRHLLFDAAVPGDQLDSFDRVELEPGEYALKTYVWKPTKDVGLVAHVFCR